MPVYASAWFTGLVVINEVGRPESMNLGSVLQHETHGSIRLFYSAGRKAVGREAGLHGLDVLRGVPIPTCPVEMSRHKDHSIDRRR